MAFVHVGTRKHYDSEVVRSTLSEIILVLLFMLLFLLGAVLEATSQFDSSKDVSRVAMENEALKEEIEKQRGLISSLQEEIDVSSRAKVSTIFELSTERFFPSCGFRVDPEFEDTLRREVSHRIENIIEEHEMENPVIDIVGHTSERRLALCKRNSTMDRDNLLLDEEAGLTSNVELGMARALGVTRILRSLPPLVGYDFRPMSAGQYLHPESGLVVRAFENNESEERRRIEIRVWSQ